ncbi:MAG: TIGR03546 family protein [Bdellovibrionaceae bacterium]|nr:TIGR03546 family protein [Bdellovibrio sp.]
MGLLTKQIINLIRMLHSETGQNQIAAGLAFGVFLGFAPFLSIQTLLVLMIVFIFRVQFGAAMLSAFFFKFIAYLLDPVADQFGRWALENDLFRGLWIEMFNKPFLPMTRFNNSIVMGSFIISLFLCPILFFVFRKLIVQYRTQIVARIEATTAWKAFKATKVYEWYLKYNDLYGAV